MSGSRKKPNAQEIARDALRAAAGSKEPDVSRLVDAVPEILAEARRRRAVRTLADPPVSIVIALARTTIPRLAAASAVLALAAMFVGLRGGDVPQASDAQADLDSFILTGEMGDDVSDVLLEALGGEGEDHG